jgi:hypothetical protein
MVREHFLLSPPVKTKRFLPVTRLKTMANSNAENPRCFRLKTLSSPELNIRNFYQQVTGAAVLLTGVGNNVDSNSETENG